MQLYRTPQEERERQIRLAQDFAEAAQLIMLIGTLPKAEVVARLQQASPGCLLMFVALGQEIQQAGLG